MASFYDPSKLRIERLQADMAYHAAYGYWNLRGVLAERWAHGPDFNGTQQDGEQTTLVSGAAPDSRGFLWAVYGLRALGMNAEGPDSVERTRTDLLRSWTNDAFQVLNPKRVVKLDVAITALYPVENPVVVSRRIRSHFYQHEALEGLVPTSLKNDKDRFHAAINMFFPAQQGANEGSGSSIIAGVIGPPHRGLGFFAQPDDDRDGQWWMGVIHRRRIGKPGGITGPLDEMMLMVETTYTDVLEVAKGVLSEALK